MSGISIAKDRNKSRNESRIRSALRRSASARSCAAALAILALLASPSAWAAEKIRFGLNWLPEGEHCGFFQAKAAGLYRRPVSRSSSRWWTRRQRAAPGQQRRLDLGMGSSFTT